MCTVHIFHIASVGFLICGNTFLHTLKQQKYKRIPKPLSLLAPVVPVLPAIGMDCCLFTMLSHSNCLKLQHSKSMMNAAS